MAASPHVTMSLPTKNISVNSNSSMPDRYPAPDDRCVAPEDHTTDVPSPTVSEPTDTSSKRSMFSNYVLNQLDKFMESDEYEDLPTDNWGIHMVAGCAAGITEHCAFYPVDLVKTRMMAISGASATQYNGVLHSIKSISAGEGVMTLWRGMRFVMMGCAPAHACYFTVYEYGKARMGKNNPLGHFIAGAGASLAHDLIMTPVDAVKQRMQRCGSAYQSGGQCCKLMCKQEGVMSLYRSYGTQISMNVPQQGIHFVIYEYLKNLMNPDNSYRPDIHLLCGGVAGGVAGAITTPFDVCKTLLNTQPKVPLSPNTVVIRGLFNAGRTIVKVEGWRGLYKGVSARVITIAPSTAVCWLTYEAFKALLIR